MRIGRWVGIILGLLLLSLGLRLGLEASPAKKRIALIIGNSQYQNLRPLVNPRNDAQAVARVLKGLGFTLIGPTDGVYYDLNEEAFLAARNELERRAAGAEIVLVYYAGHGMQGKTGPYLLPVDVPKVTQNTDMERVIRRSIDLQETLQLLDGKASLVVAVFDACREIAEFRAAGLGGIRGIERVRTSGRNRVIAYSAASGQVVPDGDSEHSLYTKKLLDYLAQPGLEVGDLFRRVSYEVGQQYDQQPEVLVQGVPPGTYYLVPPVEKEPPVPPVAIISVPAPTVAPSVPTAPAVTPPAPVPPAPAVVVTPPPAALPPPPPAPPENKAAQQAYQVALNQYTQAGKAFNALVRRTEGKTPTPAEVRQQAQDAARKAEQASNYEQATAQIALARQQLTDEEKAFRARRLEVHLEATKVLLEKRRIVAARRVLADAKPWDSSGAIEAFRRGQTDLFQTVARGFLDKGEWGKAQLVIDDLGQWDPKAPEYSSLKAQLKLRRR